jgi:hypothetical protein
MRALHAQRNAKLEGIEMIQPKLKAPRTPKQEQELLEYMYLDTMYGQEVWIKHYETIGECPRYDTTLIDNQQYANSGIE